jgi:protein-histidine pros-kinase
MSSLRDIAILPRTIWWPIVALFLVALGLVGLSEWYAVGAESGPLRGLLRSHQVSRAAFGVMALMAIGVVVVMTKLFVTEVNGRAVLARRAEQERERLEELVRDRTRELATLSTYLQQNAEQEKADLGRNLHDDMGGLLTAARMDLAWLRARSQSSDAEYLGKWRALDTIINEAMALERRVVAGLRPALLDHFGLPTALQVHFDESCRQAGLQCNISIAGNSPNLPSELAIALYRVAQEALANVIQHAKARAVSLSVGMEPQGYCVVVHDDGRGMNVREARERGTHGLSGMRHRVESLGGKFEIDSGPNRGTAVRVSVPVPR